MAGGVSFLDVTPFLLMLETNLRIRAVTVGGTPPYLFAVGQDDDKLDPTKDVPEGSQAN